MATSFEVFYLGNLPLIDTQEGDQYVSTSAVNSWLGTYGGPGNGLSDAANIKQFAPGPSGYAGGNSTWYDTNNNASNDQFTIDGVPQTIDATMVFNATLTYPDGTTANISAVVFQDTQGNVYLAPELTNNADQQALSAGPIQSLTLNSPIYSFGNNGQATNLLADRFSADFVPCFTPGAAIATPRGEVAVENLRVGDRVFTRDHGIQDIAWIGRKSLSAADLAQKGSYQPVMVRAGSLGPNLPESDLLLSPNHRVLMTGRDTELYFDETEVLVAAKHLTHLEGIDTVQAATGVEYIHLMFAQHQVILSNGTWSESFQPGDYSLRGVGTKQRQELVDLFPELGTKEGVDGYNAARTILRRHEAKLIS